MRSRSPLILVLLIPFLLWTARASKSPPVPLRPGTRVLLDAHNCYPYFEWWSDRIDRALSAGTPLAIEQDLLWARNPRTGKMASLLSHGNLAWLGVNDPEPVARSTIDVLLRGVRPDGKR